MNNEIVSSINTTVNGLLRKTPATILLLPNRDEAFLLMETIVFVLSPLAPSFKAWCTLLFERKTGVWSHA